MYLSLILMMVASSVDSSVLPILRIVDLTNPRGPHFTVQNFSNVGNSLDSQLIVSPTSTPSSTTPFVPPAFQNLRNSVNLDWDATQGTLRLNWGQNRLFARDAFAPVFSELRGNQLEEHAKVDLVVTLHPEEALARKIKS